MAQKTGEIKIKIDIADVIQKEYNNGNIVIFDGENLNKIKIKDFMQQPIDGVLYDLNRSKEVALANIKDNNLLWINNYACAVVIEELSRIITELKNV